MSVEHLLKDNLSVEEELALLQQHCKTSEAHSGAISREKSLSQSAILEQALCNPVGEGALSFAQLLNRAKAENHTILLVVNDAERATTPTHLMLDAVLPHFFSNDISLRLAIATGTHKDPSEKDLESIFGRWLPILRERNVLIFANQSGEEHILQAVPHPNRKDETLRTQRGTPVRAHHSLFASNQIVISLNSVEPHPRAGFTGGTKSLWPGMGAKKDILRNHNQVLLHGQEDVLWNEDTQSTDPIPHTISQVGPLSVSQNPERLDMTEVVTLIDQYRKETLGLLPFHSLNVVMDVTGSQVLSAAWGKPRNVSDQLNPIATDVYSYEAKNAKAVILEIPSPQGDTLEQSLKSLAFIQSIVQPEMHIILVAALSKGAGTAHFEGIFENQTTIALQATLAQHRSNFSQAPSGLHTVPSVVHVLEKSQRIHAVPRQPLSLEITSQLAKYPILSMRPKMREVLTGIEADAIFIITNSTMMVPRFAGS